MDSTKIDIECKYEYSYSICTMVTDLTEYDEMKNSFSKAGFGESDCQFLYADNSYANQFDAYTAINRFIGEAKGRYIIICHQDILVEHDNRDVLENRIREISEIDPEWGLLGNAGASNLYAVSMVITENGSLIRKGVLPSRVSSLDENFLLIKAEANLGVSHDLGGFHLYGTDICLIAECMGRSSYVIDFNITHKSPGRMNQSFYDISAKLQNKYNRFLRGRYIKTTITRFYIGAGPFLSAIMNLGLVKNIVRLFNKLRYNKRVKKAKKYKS